MQSMRLIGVGFIVFLFFPIRCIAADDLVRFPGVEKIITSPDKQFSIYNEDHDVEPNHSLLLKNEKTGILEKILDYERHTDVAWAPDSAAFFVNDYVGSDSVNCLVITLTDGTKTIDVMGLLKKFNKDKDNVFSSHHLFATCKTWIKGGRLIISLSGYGDQKPNGFEYEYQYDIKNLIVRRIKSK